MKSRPASPGFLLSALGLAAVLLFAADLALGSVRIPLGGVLDALLGRGTETAWSSIVLVFRLPKALTALAAGAALAVSGLILQTVFRNPLAGPDSLGIGAGASVGVALVVLGWLWNFQFPVIKKIWTSSYVLVAGGYSCMLLGLFYLIVDVWKCQKWAQPFVWIGANSITIYLVHNIINFQTLSARFAGGDVQRCHPVFPPG